LTTETDRVHVFSFGGGVQSTACLVLAARGELPATDTSHRWDAFVFAHVGEASENPATLDYVENVAKPYAAAHGIELREVRKARRDGTPDDLLALILRTERSLPFPVRMMNGAPGQRSCPAEYKIRPLEREHKRMGATTERPGIVGIGISMDELQRAKGWGEVDPRSPSQIREYPLLRLQLRRRDCLEIIREAGLPQPPRSACWFCPFHSLDEWRRLRRDHPELWQRAVELERTLIERRHRLGKDAVYLTRYGRPIDEVVHDQLTLGVDDPGTDEAPCDSGHCFL